MEKDVKKLIREYFDSSFADVSQKFSKEEKERKQEIFNEVKNALSNCPNVRKDKKTGEIYVIFQQTELSDDLYILCQLNLFDENGNLAATPNYKVMINCYDFTLDGVQFDHYLNQTTNLHISLWYKYEEFLETIFN